MVLLTFGLRASASLGQRETRTIQSIEAANTDDKILCLYIFIATLKWLVGKRNQTGDRIEAN